MNKFDILHPGDMVMKIPGPLPPGIFYDTGALPDGACGTVLEGEADLPYWDSQMVPYIGYGCYVDFPSAPSIDGRGWFVNRPRLMKINPNDTLKNEIVDDDIGLKIYEAAKAIAETE